MHGPSVKRSATRSLILEKLRESALLCYVYECSYIHCVTQCSGSIHVGTQLHVLLYDRFHRMIRVNSHELLHTESGTSPGTRLSITPSGYVTSRGLLGFYLHPVPGCFHRRLEDAH